VACSIDAYLNGKAFVPEVRFKDIDTKAKRSEVYVPMKTAEKVCYLDPKERTKHFNEVEGGFDTAEAAAEAKRCLRCYRVIVWEK
jgi:hypothetical protein